jgi:hypothetical protein
MEQPVARYHETDLPRVVTRDFAGHDAEVMEILAAYPRRTRTSDGGLRVQMACLKLAGGCLARLRRVVDAACGDFRDVLAAAEYPAYLRAATRAEIEEAICTDWTQLQTWLHATEPQRADDADTER